jgi:hypothetical protein
MKYGLGTMDLVWPFNARHVNTASSSPKFGFQKNYEFGGKVYVQ